MGFIHYDTIHSKGTKQAGCGVQLFKVGDVDRLAPPVLFAVQEMPLRTRRLEHAKPRTLAHTCPCLHHGQRRQKDSHRNKVVHHRAYHLNGLAQSHLIAL